MRIIKLKVGNHTRTILKPTVKDNLIIAVTFAFLLPLKALELLTIFCGETIIKCAGYFLSDQDN